MERKNVAPRAWCAALILCLLLSVAGCGRGYVSASYDAATDGVLATNKGGVDYGFSAGGAPVASLDYSGYESAAYDFADEFAPDRTPGQKWITTLRYDAETQHYDDATFWLYEKVDSVGGYVESANEYNTSSDERFCDLTIRIPASNLESFLEGFEDQLHLTRKYRNRDDVTLEYSDVETWKSVLKSEQSRLLELLELADSVEDILAIESRLADVKRDLETAESRLRVYDNRVDYSTMYLNLREVKRFSHVPVNVGEEISDGILDNAVWVLDTAVGAAIYLVTHLPAIAALCLLVFGFVRLKRAFKRFCSKRCIQLFNPVKAWRLRRQQKFNGRDNAWRR